MIKMAKVNKASKASKMKAKPVKKTPKVVKTSKASKPAKTLKGNKVKVINKSLGKVALSNKAKTQEKGRRILSDAKIAKLQKMYRSGKQTAKSLCEEFGISMATLFNYLKVSV
jgi:hypothetical protein